MSDRESKGTASDVPLPKTIEEKYAIKLPKFSTLMIWAVGFLIASGLTIKDILPLILDYDQNNVATQVEVIPLDEEFKPPEVVIFYPNGGLGNDLSSDMQKLAACLHEGIDCDEIMIKKLENASFDVWADPDLMGDNYTDAHAFGIALTMAFIKKISMNVSSAEAIIDDDQSDWNGPVISAIMDYFQMRTKSDFYINKSPRDHSETLRYMYEYGSAGDIDDDHLKSLFLIFIKIICKKISFTETSSPSELLPEVDSGKTCLSLLSNEDAPMMMDTYGYWIPLPALSKPRFMTYHITVKGNQTVSRSSSIPHSDDQASILLYSDYGIQYVKNIDEVYFHHLFEAPPKKLNKGQRITARYKVMMRAIETRKGAPCWNGTSVKSCFIDCTKKWITEKCSCRLFSSRHFSRENHSFPYCTPRNVTDCNITGLPEDTKESCIKSCKNACEFASYTWQISYDTFETNTSEFILRLFPLVDTFAEFRWTVKTTPEQFYSQLAGIASFYLGISGLSIFVLLIRVIDWWKRFKLLQIQNGNAFQPKDGREKNQGNQADWIAQLDELITRKVAEEVKKQLGCN